MKLIARKTVGQQTNANGNVWDGQRVEWEK